MSGRDALDALIREYMPFDKTDQALALIAELTQQRNGALAMLDRIRTLYVVPSGNPADGWSLCSVCGSVWAQDDRSREKQHCPLYPHDGPTADRAREIGSAVADLVALVDRMKFLPYPDRIAGHGVEPSGFEVAQALAAYRRATGMQGSGEEG